jgi:hypothetical protein
LGSAVIVYFHWIYYPRPTEISFNDVRNLVDSNQVKHLQTNGSRLVEGVVKAPQAHPHLVQGCFRAVIPAGEGVNQLPLHKNPTLQVTAASTHPPPPGWSVLLILGIPTALALLMNWPLGAASWFPLLKPRPQS